ncbi:MAG: bifunctional phosphoribosylaminoimidazolecarboxamide formyltransferase/IMP cyclohydrolase [Pseudomonadota bacterium]|nr:bifunctional phosphoribosylaminoimidazolecarboxamide formyltransferase/IMP cyclohydrolase [Pseudomonadota bacterium]
MTAIRRALISVSDKTGLEEFCIYLASIDVEILSTGGTAKTLRSLGIKVKDVSEETGFPEIMDGRVKTLHPKIHGGLLAIRDNDAHQKAMITNSIGFIDLLVVNLYPFGETVASGAEFSKCIENIDIGGPALIRAAAKNFKYITVVVNPKDYNQVVDEMKAEGGSTTIDFRKQLAARAFAQTCSYDTAIANWFSEKPENLFPPHIILSAERKQFLRYGENPHQQAAFYINQEKRPGVASAEQIQGKELSYNNLNDTDAAFELVGEFTNKPACVIVKHANPCGVAQADTLVEAYKRALACDTESAFGGIIATNRMLDSETATEIAKLFTEVIIVPGVEDGAKKILLEKENLRLLVTGEMPNLETEGVMLRSLSGGYLLQSRDSAVTEGELRVVTKRAPTASEMLDLTFAFTVAKHVKSNAIVYAKGLTTVGIGAGQMSRINSSRIASWKAAAAAKVAGHSETWAKGCVAASDAFFPFSDGLLAIAEEGATAVIQPGGSLRDDEVIAAADAAGLAMIFTGMRHFRH